MRDITCCTNAGSRFATPCGGGGGAPAAGGGGGGAPNGGGGIGAGGAAAVALARGSILARGSDTGGGAGAAAGTAAARGSLRAAALGSLARGSAALVAGTPIPAPARGFKTPGIVSVDTEVWIISSLLIRKSIASGNWGCPLNSLLASSGSRSAISFNFATMSYISLFDICFKASATAFVPALLGAAFDDAEAFDRCVCCERSMPNLFAKA